MKMWQVAWNSDRVRRYWKKKARTYKDFSGSPSTLFYRERELETLGEFFSKLEGKKFFTLDLWDEVHNTRVLSWAFQQGAVPYGIDIADYQVSLVREKFKRWGIPVRNFKQSDMRDIKFPADSFDVLFSLGTIEHVPDYDRAARETYRVLKPGGMAIIGVPNKLDPFLRPLLVWFLDLLGKYPYSPEKSFTRKELVNLFEKEGFEVVDNIGFVFQPGLLRMADIFFYLHFKPMCLVMNALMWPFFTLERRFKWVGRHGYIIACVLRKPKRRVK